MAASPHDQDRHLSRGIGLKALQIVNLSHVSWFHLLMASVIYLHHLVEALDCFRHLICRPVID